VTVRAASAAISRIESQLGSRRLAQWLVSGREGTLLVDSGVVGTVAGPIAAGLTELEIDFERVVEVAITHADVDHYGGNAELRQLAPAARIRAHPLDRPAIERFATIAAERYGWYRQFGLDYPPQAWEWLREVAGPDTPLDGELAAGERIDLGGVELEVLHLPGHSRGHLGLLEPGSGTAIVADAAMGYGFETVSGERASPGPYVDLAAYRETLAQLRELAPRRLETSHFAPLEGEAVGAFLELSHRFTDDLERALEGQRGAGLESLPGLLEPVARELGGYPQMEVELARSIGAHLEAENCTFPELSPS
jgi:glyoxylase-like metal-dependent hydrolase (beta-lactamase superfamily II)